MTNDTRQEIFKAHIYGYSNERIAEVTGIDPGEISAIITLSAQEIDSKRAHINTMTVTPLGVENTLNVTKAATVGGKTYYGIDVSVWNGYVDWKKVKAAGKSFAFIRSGYGNTIAYPRQIDNRFAENVKNARAAGVDFGIYHYCYATNTTAAKAEAQGFVRQLNGVKPIPHLVLLDIEEASQQRLSGTTKAAIINAFMDVVKAAGYMCAVYSYEAFLNTIAASERAKWVNWVANISRRPTIPHDGWQYSFTGRINGIAGNVDLDQTSINFPAKIKAAGKNGYSKPADTKKALDTEGYKRGGKLAKEQELGVYALKCRLRALGYSVKDDGGFGSGTEKAVNSLLKKWGYRENGVAGKNFMKFVMK